MRLLYGFNHDAAAKSALSAALLVGKCMEGSVPHSAATVHAAIRLQRYYRQLRLTYIRFGPCIFCRRDGLPAPYGRLGFQRGAAPASARVPEGRPHGSAHDHHFTGEPGHPDAI